MQFLGLCIIDRDDEASTAFKRNAHDDEPTLLNSLHWSVAGPRFHGRHEWSPFLDLPPLSRMERKPLNLATLSFIFRRVDWCQITVESSRSRRPTSTSAARAPDRRWMRRR